MLEKSTINVTCAIIFFDQKILVTQRSETMKLPLKWEFPGGKLEDNETEVDCIKREIKEEINIDIEVLEKLSSSIYNYGTFQIKLIPFLANFVSGEIKLTEHKEYKLLNKSELRNLDWAEADKPIVEELLKLEI
ncbi:(deoxy)nucleoside triphosphate pyrophosphohydrolase [Flavobacterium sandaracinum]|uniref:8-oxo-dGTP diphosphatase n=1 Tax=Flavobacterium sandaracinum TaxID=2541733 RepID=A0A4R5D5H1_9FLAO|nr:(deoxy)nucleoside triphosphate pyrophosphohydrolase [Flavobacterium sandaracinum]TDE07787.1 (deoxy)nucleoside triphosphate pyrophosphohydrolase [Flavobacterium sandaracinum]